MIFVVEEDKPKKFSTYRWCNWDRKNPSTSACGEAGNFLAIGAGHWVEEMGREGVSPVEVDSSFYRK